MERYVEPLQISQLIGIERKGKRLSMYMHEISKMKKVISEGTVHCAYIRVWKRSNATRTPHHTAVSKIIGEQLCWYVIMDYVREKPEFEVTQLMEDLEAISRE